MATDLNNNIFINEFKGGMNSDTSYDSLQNNQYIFGKNIRITNNALLNKAEDSNCKEGILCPIDSGEIVNNYGVPLDGVRILATASIDNIGAIIVKDSKGFWHVYRINEEDYLPVKIFSSDTTTDKEKFSVVLNKELEDSVKLYIADGVHLIMCIDIHEHSDSYNLNLTSIYDLISNSYFPQSKVLIEDKINGLLPACQLQYVYRFYKKNGIKSKMSPLTNKILVIDSNKSREEGNSEGTVTTVGFKLGIPLSSKEKKLFTHVQIYRLTYNKIHEDSKIDLIYDSAIKEETKISINDDGLNSIQLLSVDEFSSLNGMDIVPDSIELNLGYMFAANINDETIFRIKDDEYDSKSYQYNLDGDIVLYHYNDTQYTNPYTFSDIEEIQHECTLNKYSDINIDTDIYDIKDTEGIYYIETNKTACILDGNSENKYLGGKGKNISWKFIKTYIPIHNTNNKEIQIPNTLGCDNKGYVYFIKYDGDLFVDEYSGLKVETIAKLSGILYKEDISYDNIITSSMFRSLKRDEVYRYGIVFYDKFGRRSQTKWIADIKVPGFIKTTELKNGVLYAAAIGILFNVKNMPKDTESYQIVRCSKNDMCTKNILLCVVSRPIRQLLPSSNDIKKYSPYYPSYLLTSSLYGIHREHEIYDTNYIKGNGYPVVDENDENDITTIQIFSPYITYRRNDCLSLLKSSNIGIKQLNFCYMIDKDKLDNKDVLSYFKNALEYYVPLFHILIDSQRLSLYLHQSSDKVNSCNVFHYYHNTDCAQRYSEIIGIADVLNPNWEDGYSNHLLTGESVTNAVKQYKTYTTNVGNIEYVNWSCDGLYDIPATSENNQSGVLDDVHALWSKKDGNINIKSGGTIGPGPICFVAKILKTADLMFGELKRNQEIHSTICNIQHKATLFGGFKNHDKQYDTYYGFGNFKKYDKSDTRINVFDGDTYITPFEIVSLFKAYDFNSTDTLGSSQFVYYVPIESSINTFFDYGMNYRNTQNKNLQLEPGEITGVTSQDRPLCLYNMIYADNNVSNDVFGSLEDEEDITTIPLRIFYSLLKNPGERIDSWSYFLPIDYIDADARHGEITHIMTSKDILYFWQKQALGRLSVNERSLITDNNSNLIQLGQGGVLQRTDYIDTRHGMRKGDRSSTIALNQVYWIDILNKAIVVTNGQLVQNISELFNVLNIVNERMTDDIPNIHYDQQNNELVCKCLGDDQLVFNIKLGAATSIYERRFDDVILFNNVIYGLSSNVKMIKYNYLKDRDNRIFMPTEVKFVINPAASTTKVFDNQEIVLLYKQDDKFLEEKQFTFSTNLINENLINPDGYTDREGNIKYAIPREQDVEYGSRIRGKWLKVGIQDNNPSYYSSISHIITKFRQSFS